MISITLDELYDAVVKKILSHDEKFKDTPFGLTLDVQTERYSKEEAVEMIRTNEMDDMMFDLMDMMRAKGKESGYTMRLVPCKYEGGRWGMPYTEEYYFSKITKQRSLYVRSDTWRYDWCAI